LVKRLHPETLQDHIRTQLDMTVYEFARVISIDPSTLNRWWSQRRFAVKLMVAGYRSVVRNQDTPGLTDQVIES